MSTEVVCGIFKNLTDDQFIIVNNTEKAEFSIDKVFMRVYKRFGVEIEKIIENIEHDEPINNSNSSSNKSNESKAGFNILLKLISGEEVTLKVLPNDTIESVQQQVKDMTGLSIDMQRIMFAGKHLDSQRTLEDYGIQKECELHVGLRLRGGSNENKKVFIKTCNNNLISVKLNKNDNIQKLKQIIEDIKGIPYFQQEFLFNNKELKNDVKISDLNTTEDRSIHLMVNLNNKIKLLENDILDPPYDYDFTNINDNGRYFIRGGEKYYRPCGWIRIALKVKGKYNDDTWLGSSNTVGEWPVAYHGTNFNGLKGICYEGFDLKKLKRFAHGKGHYTTPFIDTAEIFATQIEIGGKKIKFILQCRVHPLKLIRANNDKYWILPNDYDIRPYGICYKILDD